MDGVEPTGHICSVGNGQVSAMVMLDGRPIRLSLYYYTLFMVHIFFAHIKCFTTFFFFFNEWIREGEIGRRMRRFLKQKITVA